MRSGKRKMSEKAIDLIIAIVVFALFIAATYFLAKKFQPSGRPEPKKVAFYVVGGEEIEDAS